MWHVVQTAGGCESNVCKYLALHAITTYAPEFPRGRTRPGSVRDLRRRRVFPGYVFFSLPQGFTRWELVRWAPGVKRVLEQDGRPAFIDATVFEHMRQRVVEAGRTHAGSRFQRGQRVVVERGALAMVDAIFDRCLSAPDRVRILVQLLGREVAVEIDPATLRAAS